MQYQYIGYRVKGFYHISRNAMKADNNSEVAAHRLLSVLRFRDQHGLQAPWDHSGKSRRTLVVYGGLIQGVAIEQLVDYDGFRWRDGLLRTPDVFLIYNGTRAVTATDGAVPVALSDWSDICMAGGADSPMMPMLQEK